MKRVTLLCGLLLALTAGVAAAAPGVNIRWNNCIGDAGLLNRNFACNTNGGSAVMVLSFELGEDILASSGQEVVVDVGSGSASLPAWWGFLNAGTCRQGSLSVNSALSPAAVACADWAQNGPATAGLGAYQIGLRGPNTARVKVAIAVQLSGLSDLLGGTEYFSCNLQINNAKTVGTGACAGCGVPVCIVFNSIKNTTQDPINDRTTTGPSNGFDSDFVTWQGGGGVVVGGVPGCGAATPTKNATWGAVKAMYH
jgi:hypothetical protein